jgi:hypothetical protein
VFFSFRQTVDHEKVIRLHFRNPDHINPINRAKRRFFQQIKNIYTVHTTLKNLITTTLHSSKSFFGLFRINYFKVSSLHVVYVTRYYRDIKTFFCGKVIRLDGFVSKGHQMVGGGGGEGSLFVRG